MRRAKPKLNNKGVKAEYKYMSGAGQRESVRRDRGRRCRGPPRADVQYEEAGRRATRSRGARAPRETTQRVEPARRERRSRDARRLRVRGMTELRNGTGYKHQSQVRNAGTGMNRTEH